MTDVCLLVVLVLAHGSELIPDLQAVFTINALGLRPVPRAYESLLGPLKAF